LARYRVEAGDILVAAQRDTTGRSGLAGDHTQGAFISQHLARVAVDPTICHPAFLAEVFRSDLIKSQVDAVKLKTTRPGLNTDDVASFWIPLPSICEQERFYASVEYMVQGTRACSASVSAARTLLLELVNNLTAP